MNISRLKEIREDKDLSQADLAKLLKITQPQYSRYELGVNIIPLEKLEQLANFYDTSMDYIELMKENHILNQLWIKIKEQLIHCSFKHLF